MHLLSLPGPPPPLEMSSVQRRKTPKAEQTRMANAATERRLETLMDKLNVWGLMGDVELGRSRIDSHHTKDELDWIQLFSKDVVESQCVYSLPTSHSESGSKNVLPDSARHFQIYAIC